MASTTEKTDAATKRRQAEDGFTPEERETQLLAALAEERRGYVARGLTERVAQVDEQIKAHGGKPPAAKASAPAAPDAPKA